MIINEIDEYDNFEIIDTLESLTTSIFTIKNTTKNTQFQAKFSGSEREIKILQYGGYLNFAMSDEF
ncbi:MAG: hypothetical protein WAU19_04845 [Leptotrichiaceae bacterium]